MPSDPVARKFPKLERGPGPRGSTELGKSPTLVGMPPGGDRAGHPGVERRRGPCRTECGLTTGLMS